MDVRYHQNIGDELFKNSKFQRKIEQMLRALDTCGQSVYISVLMVNDNPDAVTLMCRRESGGPFPGSPPYKKYKLWRSAYEEYEVACPDESDEDVQKAIAQAKEFIREVQEALERAR